MNDSLDVFRRLQIHLDHLAVGMPAVESGADIHLLEALFSPQEAALALRLSNRHDELAEIMARVGDAAGEEFGPELVENGELVKGLLDGMAMKGVIGWSSRDGVDRWYLQPLVVGTLETALGATPQPSLLAAFRAYLEDLQFAGAFLASQPFQVRVVPIGESIPVEHHIAQYDDLRQVIAASPGPFAVHKCMCREMAAGQGKPCSKTARPESCLGIGDMAAAGLRHGAGREISREEALALLGESEQDGLVLQTSNAQQPDFVCACCGCCCGLLGMQKVIPRPADVWASDFQCTVDEEACSQCEECVDRCQVGALAMTGPWGTAEVDQARCIGCGVCVPSCSTMGLRLVPKQLTKVPPPDVEALFVQSAASRAAAVDQTGS